MALWTTTEDVLEAWIGEDKPTDTASVENYIGKAERLIRFKVPGIQARVDAIEADLLENIIDVVSSMVIRKFRNPEGIRTTNTSTGPFSESRTFGGDEPGELAIQDGELARLSLGASGRAHSVSLIPTTSPFYVAT